MKARRPNLFVIGAMKSGTSSLHAHLASHPEIFMSSWKEPNHFTGMRRRVKSRSAYLNLFADASNERWLGESSTNYSKRPFKQGVPERLLRFEPGARIIYIMRDPFERIVSQYKHMVRTGEERHPVDRIWQGPSDYVSNSYYAYQLEPYLRLFEREQVLCLKLESLDRDPVDCLSRVFSWLGVDAGHRPPRIRRRHYVSPTTLTLLEDSRLATVLEPIRRVPGGQRLARAARSSLSALFTKPVHVSTSDDDFGERVEALRARLSPLLACMIRELSTLTGNAYDEWPSASGAELAWDVGSVWLPTQVRDRLRRVRALG